MDRVGHLRKLREHEARIALRDLPESGRVLEIGAGSGWQARMFSDLGYEADAIDVPQSHYLDETVFPVKTYDGRRIPFVDTTFDIVFSSNVLEHIPHVKEFQAEIRRVLAPGGFAIHLMPSSTWCFWNNLTYYWVMPGKLLSRLRARPAGRPPAEDLRFQTGVGDDAQLQNIDPVGFKEFARILRTHLRALRKIFPQRHGEIGNALTEMYWFSPFRWKRLFESESFLVRTCRPNRLFYTGHQAFGDRLSIRWRGRLSRLLGSSCYIYVVDPLNR